MPYRHRSTRAELLRPTLVAVATLLAAAAGGQQERFSERVEVTEVEVPVRVLVKREPVAGLTRDDFELFDEGERREIVGFRVRRWRGGAAAAEAAAPSGPVEDGRRLLVLFDFAFARRDRLARAQRDLADSLPRLLGPGDRLAVGTYGSLSGPDLLVGFTDDRAKIGLALEAVGAMLDAKQKRQRELLAELHEARFGGGGEGSTFRTLERELGTTAALAVLSGPVVYAEAEDDGVELEVQESIFAPIRVRVEVDVTEPIVPSGDDGAGGARALGLSLAELAYMLREVPGQKEILLLSEGFAGGLLRDARALFYLEKAQRALRDSGWTVHGVDLGGIGGIDERNFDADSLLYFADGTGGELVENTNDFSRATKTVFERTEVVYVLSFQPPPGGTPGEFRKLDVRLTKRLRGARVLHRPGYYSQRPPARREIFERRVDGVEWLLTNLEAAELEVATFAEVLTDPLGGVRVPVAVEVGGGSLRSGDSRRSTRVELLLAVLDAGGELRELVTGETVVDRRRSEMWAGGGVRFLGELAIAPGDYRLRVLVRSHRAGEVFLATHPLSVGVGAGAVPTLPPIPERPAEGWITVETEGRAPYFR